MFVKAMFLLLLSSVLNDFTTVAVIFCSFSYTGSLSQPSQAELSIQKRNDAFICDPQFTCCHSYTPNFGMPSLNVSELGQRILGCMRAQNLDPYEIMPERHASMDDSGSGSGDPNGRPPSQPQVHAQGMPTGKQSQLHLNQFILQPLPSLQVQKLHCDADS